MARRNSSVPEAAAEDEAYYYENDEGLGEEWEDPCQEFNHSIIFFLIVAAAVVLWSLYGWLLFVRRPRLYGFDVLFSLLYVVAAIRFGPKIWGALQVHGVYHVSQSGCKLVAYTEFGLRHVNSFLVVALVSYAWITVYHPQYDLDITIKSQFAWLLLLLFVLQGVTGMVPTIFTDVDKELNRCDFTHSDSLGPQSFLATQVLLSTIIPYVVPFLLLGYPLYRMTRDFGDVEDLGVRSSTKIILTVGWTFIGLTLPWALHALVMLPLIQTWSSGYDAITVCVVDGLFRLLLEIWYIVCPATTIFMDRDLGKGLPGTESIPWALGWTSRALARICGRR